jgi:hypothetical protein
MELRNLQNPTDNKGYKPLKQHIALIVVQHAEKADRTKNSTFGFYAASLRKNQ